MRQAADSYLNEKQPLWILQHRLHQLLNQGEGQHNDCLLSSGVWELCNPALSHGYWKIRASVLIEEQAVVASRYYVNYSRHNPSYIHPELKEIL